jgi:hypothetical protein
MELPVVYGMLAYFAVLALKTWKAKKVAIVCDPLSQGGTGAGTGDGQRSREA